VLGPDGTEIERIEQYALLHALLSDLTLPTDYRNSMGSITQGYAVPYIQGAIRHSTGAQVQVGAGGIVSTNGAATAVTPTHRLVVDSQIDYDTRTPMFAAAGAGSSLTFCIPLLGIFSWCQRFIPLQFLAPGGIDIELTLARPQDVLRTLASDVDYVPVYSISAVEFCATLVQFDSEFEARFRQIMQMGVSMHTIGVENYASIWTTGVFNAPINARKKSIKSIFIVIRDTNVVNSTDGVAYRIAHRANPMGTGRYQFRIGPILHPAQPVSSPEVAWAELQKALGNLMSDITTTGGIITKTSYTVGNAQQNEVLSGAADVLPFILGKGAFGIDLDSFGPQPGGLTYLEQGTNTASLNLPITFEANFTGIPSAGPPAGQFLVNAFVMFDEVLTLLPSGLISVSS